MADIKAPLYEALVQFASNNPVSFHVPGHKNGFVGEETGNQFFSQLLKIDLTELTGLDDLHSPEGVIAEAQELTASLYGVKSSYFLVNGSTVGNLSMILASCSSGDRVIVQRNCHKSVMHALYLAKVKPVFVAPIYDTHAGFQTGVTPEILQKALEKYPDSKAIILTNPNYYGASLNLQPIIEMAHNNKIPVLVDEAHGAHFCLGGPFPESAINQGADIVVHSAHKTLPAMTMGSYLHFNSGLVKEDKVKFYLNILQSSSPSYPIMASLDLARAYLESFRAKGYQHILEDYLDFRKKAGQIDGINVVESIVKGVSNDPLKIILQAEGNVTGYKLKDMLEKANIYPELADSKNVLLVLPLAVIKNKDDIIKRIKRAVAGATMIGNEAKPEEILIEQDQISEIQLTYQEMDDTPTQTAMLFTSEGKISAEDIIPYPPGIPLVLRGERISASQIEKIKELLEQGAVFQGNISLTQQNQIKVFNI